MLSASGRKGFVGNHSVVGNAIIGILTKHWRVYAAHKDILFLSFLFELSFGLFLFRLFKYAGGTRPGRLERERWLPCSETGSGEGYKPDKVSTENTAIFASHRHVCVAEGQGFFVEQS